MTPNDTPADGADYDWRGFLPATAVWFADRLGPPTEAQRRSWPLIKGGGNVLIHSPTGSGKTLAAFLAAIDDSFATPRSEVGSKRTGQSRSSRRRQRGSTNRGVRVLYISPLRALNYDIERNLQAPISGIAQQLHADGADPHAVEVAVRTGDTPAAERARMVRRPPEFLITTPESFYLILTSPRARDILRTVETVIVDEIHTMCSNKRGVHLALSLERLERLAPGFQRIGLSATQNPLSEVAKLLGGQNVRTDGSQHPREVQIVDCAGRADLDVKVYGMPEADRSSPEYNVWQGIAPSVLDDIEEHRTTLVFTNSRRQAENTADRLNNVLLARDTGTDEAAAVGAGVRGSGAIEGPFKAHHGSISDTMRHQIEADLKAGRLPALVGTSSLELGIDIGSIDLVVQLQSPKSVAQGLQRVGRAGHQVGTTSVAKIYATHPEDLMEASVVARGMLDGDIEAMRIPTNALDVLAQQVVAAVAVDDWTSEGLFAAVRSAYPYRDLARGTFDSVLRLVSGHYPNTRMRTLRAQINWDKATDTLRALPGTRRTAMSHAGTIVDRGAFNVVLPDRKTVVGNLDEEFVYESNAGDIFTLGSQTWRAIDIDDDKVVAEPAPGEVPRMPFWRGEFPWRQSDLGARFGAFRAAVATHLEPHLNDDEEEPPEVVEWLTSEYPIDDVAALQIIQHVRAQMRVCGTVSSDQAIVVETYQDDIGDMRVVVHSPFGGRINGPWSVAAIKELVDRGYIEPESQVNDDGFMLRLHDAGADSDAAPLIDAVARLPSETARRHLLDGIIDSPMFGATFRQNAARSMLMPNVGFGKRTPFWLQRLRARDLLTAARDMPDFPVLLETYRDVMEDVMDLPALSAVLDRIQSGDVAVHHAATRSPSVIAQSLDFRFEDHFMYQWDQPNAERALQRLRADRNALVALFREPGAAGLLKPEAIAGLRDRGVGGDFPGVRSIAEALQMLHDYGDMTDSEVEALGNPELPAWLEDLAAQGSAAQFAFPTPSGASDRRWIAASELASCAAAIADPPDIAALSELIARHVHRRGVCAAADLQQRYAVGERYVDAAIDRLEDDGFAASGYFTDSGEHELMSLADLEEVRARTMRILRAEVQPASPLRYQQLLLRTQHLGAEHRLRQLPARTMSNGVGDASPAPAKLDNAVATVVAQLHGIAVPPAAWTQTVLPARIEDFSTMSLDRLLKDGEAYWVFAADEAPHPVALVLQGAGRSALPHAVVRRITDVAEDDLGPELAALYTLIAGEGVVTTADISRYLPAVDANDLANRLATLARRALITCDSWGVAHAVADWSQPRVMQSGSAPINPRTPPVGVRAHHRRRSSLRREFGRRYRDRQRLAPPDARWSATNRLALLGPQLDADETAARRARQLLARHGIATRQALRSDRLDWDWRPISDHLNLMELRGEVRRGYFVRGIGGLQFATSEFVDQLRADADLTPDSPLDGAGDAPALPPTAVRGSDPAWILRRDTAAMQDESVAAGIIAGLRLSDATVVMTDRPILVSTAGGAKLHADVSADAAELTAAVRELATDALERQGATNIRVSEWNGVPVLRSDGLAVLEAAGLRRDYPYMIADSLSIRAALASYN